MKNFAKLSAAGLSAALIGLASLPAHASLAETTYSTFNFTGICEDCKGTVSATLVLKDYAIGNTFGLDQFVSFTYDGSNLFHAYAITSANVETVAGEYAKHPDLGINYYAMDFSVTANGYRFFDSIGSDWHTGISHYDADYGKGSTWVEAGSSTVGNAVPEPATMLLAGLALAGLGLSRRRQSALPVC